MIEYKFRGWDATGQKGWVYGDLVHNQKVTKTGLEPRVMVGGYEVVPESVSLCTGINDRKGSMIYGGDIVSVSYKGKHIFNATIVWIDRYGGFYMDEEDEKCYSPIPKNNVKVIGTVYEQRAKDKGY
jgi:hypothetical protein